MSKIFISYRRTDTAYISNYIYDELSKTFGKDNVFMDVDSIAGGLDYRVAIERALDQCRVLVVLIGPQWLSAADAKTGQRRLDQEDDAVRLEVASALRRNTMVVLPMLVQDTQMPAAKDLPPAIADLSYRNAEQVRPGRDFHRDMEQVINTIARYVPKQPGSSAKTGSAGMGASPGTGTGLGLPRAAITRTTPSEPMPTPPPTNAPIRAETPLSPPALGPFAPSTPFIANPTPIVLTAAPMPQAPVAPAKTSMSRAWLPITLGLAALVLVCGAGTFGAVKVIQNIQQDVNGALSSTNNNPGGSSSTSDTPGTSSVATGTTSTSTTPSDPTQTFDSFCSALRSGNYSQAYTYLTSQYQGRVGSPSNLPNAVGGPFGNIQERATDCMTFFPFTINGNRATGVETVVVTDPSFGKHTIGRTFAFALENGVWKIDDVYAQ